MMILKRLELYEKRKEIMDNVQKELDSKPANKIISKRRM